MVYTVRGVLSTHIPFHLSTDTHTVLVPPVIILLLLTVGVYQEAVTLLGRAAMSEEVVMDMVTRGAVGKVIEIARSNDEYVTHTCWTFHIVYTLYSPFIHPLYTFITHVYTYLSMLSMHARYTCIRTPHVHLTHL